MYDILIRCFGQAIRCMRSWPGFKLPVAEKVPIAVEGEGTNSCQAVQGGAWEGCNLTQQSAGLAAF